MSEVYKQSVTLHLRDQIMQTHCNESARLQQFLDTKPPIYFTFRMILLMRFIRIQHGRDSDKSRPFTFLSQDLKAEKNEEYKYPLISLSEREKKGNRYDLSLVTTRPLLQNQNEKPIFSSIKEN
ncbi:hypothetical protein NPIL_9221 [Nephila pilipes]|uniref:Uncharacterized protein n=1 Tax=Nephila pilipes TaxID=299642 RepID=A0A8X6PU23_NEPPI|nr:hypothetical protein NPIL_9221 [Nephila pilipes]